MCTRPAARRTSLIVGMEFTIKSCVQGHHFSKEFCTPEVGEELGIQMICPVFSCISSPISSYLSHTIVQRCFDAFMLWCYISGVLVGYFRLHLVWTLECVSLHFWYFTESFPCTYPCNRKEICMWGTVDFRMLIPSWKTKKSKLSNQIQAMLKDH